MWGGSRDRWRPPPSPWHHSRLSDSYIGHSAGRVCRASPQHSRRQLWQGRATGAGRPGGDEPRGADTQEAGPSPPTKIPRCRAAAGRLDVLTPGPHHPAFLLQLTTSPGPVEGLAQRGRGAWCRGAGSLHCTSADSGRRAGRWRGSRRRGSSENSLILYSGHQADYRGDTNAHGQITQVSSVAPPTSWMRHQTKQITAATRVGAWSATLPLGPRGKMRELGGFGMLSLLLSGAPSAPTR